MVVINGIQISKHADNLYDWPYQIAYFLSILYSIYFKIRGGRSADDLTCFSWLCVAVKETNSNKLKSYPIFSSINLTGFYQKQNWYNSSYG